MAVLSTSLLCLIVALASANPLIHPLSHRMDQEGKELESSAPNKLSPMQHDLDPASFSPMAYFRSLDALEGPKHRGKRQAREHALDLSLSHNDRNGNPRPVGRLHGSGQISVSGQDGRNYHANSRVGLGSVVWRSNNGRHSVGVGAAVEDNRGRFHGYRYRANPSFGGAIGYRYRF